MRNMKIKRIDNRGQISAEYLLLFCVILIVFLFMINNFITPTIDASNDVSAVAGTKAVVNTIADAVNLVYANGPGSKRTVDVNVPQDMSLTFNTTSQLVGVTVGGLNYNGNSNNTKFVNATLNYNGNINPSPLTLSKGSHTIQVYWNGTASPSVMQFTIIS